MKVIKRQGAHLVVVHLMKEKSKEGVQSKCGAKVTAADTTVWASDVTCAACLAGRK